MDKKGFKIKKSSITDSGMSTNYEFSYETTEEGYRNTTWDVTRNFKITDEESADPDEFALSRTEIRVL